MCPQWTRVVLFNPLFGDMLEEEKGGEKMKRSEFADIVNQVADEEMKKLNEKIQSAYQNDEQALAKIIAIAAASIPEVAARTTAEILVRSGIVPFEE